MSLLMFYICFITLISVLAKIEAAELRCIERERKALLQFKNGFVDDYGVFSSWQTSSQDCCLWRGVGCSNRTNHVILLDLHGYRTDDSISVRVGFSGDINYSLLKLDELEHLDLSFNGFPRIPEFMGSLRKLRYLNLSGIALEVSDIPPQLGNLSNLQTLDLSLSSLKLRNTEWLYKLSSLEYLDLSYLDLSESTNLLDNAIAGLPSLIVLQLRSCRLQKTIGNSLFPFTNFSKSLSVLDISYNYLPSSLIHPWLFNFSGSLTNIDLSYNELSSTIPEAFGVFKYLQHLSLVNTGLEGGIPPSFGNFSNLRSLYLQWNSLKDDLRNFFNLLTPSEKSIQVIKLSLNNFSGLVPDFTKFTSLRELYLDQNEIQGFISEKFEHISNLVILDLAHNQITGLLPDLSALPSLRELYFEYNRLEGTLAERIMPLFEIQSLGASSNLFNGTISERHLKNLSHLIYLDISYNALVLEINSEWSPTFSLDVISLSSCKLGPAFPTWLRTQKNLSIIDISYALINDSVPDWFWKQLTPNLRYLNLSSNQIYGTLPDLMYGDQPYIDLSFNKFSGPLPLFPSNTYNLVLNNNLFSESISVLRNLTDTFNIDLSNNQLSGELPDFWMNFTRLLYLNLENNNFSGRIPISMGYLLNDMLSMRNNSLTGELPSSLKNWARIQFLDLGENNLSGRIPAWIGNSLSELRVLSLPSNRFHGSMPTSICTLSKMQILDISSNNFSGTIPRCLGSLEAMTERKTKVLFLGNHAAGVARTRLAISHAQYVFKALLEWKGAKYEYSNTLGLITSLDLSSNAFNGQIPGEITNLLGLVALNLSRNNLGRNIPHDLGRLRWLDFLDLSRNHLVGGIPTSLSQLSNLGVLDLSNNNLSGRIPTSTQLQTFNESSYTGNLALCGPPLPNSCPGDLLPPNPQTIDDAQDQDKLITCGFFVSLFIGLVLGFWGVSGTLIISSSWRYAYFGFLGFVKDWIYVMIAVSYARLKRRFSA
nr:putative leucine-rich repeat protein, plant-type [Tanacetum cinerariifolium]GEX45723.1 putative leucine-rich repeat protein, plant-type [Tanacetum cinerariifolium]